MIRLVIDLFCKQGGCSEGYRRAGLTPVGVDLEPQPRYPFPFVQADWRDGLAHWLAEAEKTGAHVALIHASPPCQRYTTGGRVRDRENRPDLVPPVLEVLKATGLPWIVENVPGAPLENPTRLCGSAFGLGVRRHRLFQTSMEMPPAPPCRHREQGPVAGVYGNMHGSRGANPGMLPSTLESWSRAMGIDWMDAKGLAQAIPPAYTQWLGERI